MTQMDKEFVNNSYEPVQSSHKNWNTCGRRTNKEKMSRAITYGNNQTDDANRKDTVGFRGKSQKEGLEAHTKGVNL
jgi:hypothetical protein